MEDHRSFETNGKSAWKILIIDDDEDDFFIAKTMLKEARGRQIDVHWANSYAAGWDKLINNRFDAVLVDYDLGLRSGIELIREANGRGFAFPLILYTGRGSFEVDIEAMEAGATMYLTKGEVNPLLLERAIRYAIDIKQKEHDLREARETTERELAERKRAEAALLRIEARWNAAVESFDVGVIIATEDEQVIYWNPAARQMHGFTRPDEGIEPLEQTPITFELWTTDGNHLLALDEWPMRRIKRGETVRNLELRIRRPDQGWEKVFSYSGVMVDTAGGERLIFLTCQDFTENRRTEDALRESEASLRLALTAARMVAWEYDPATRKVTLSENAEEVLELPQRHENSDEGYNLIHPDDVEQHRALVESAIATSGSYVSVYRHSRSDYSIWLEEHGQVVVDPSGKNIRLVGVVQNITDRKAAEEALQQALAEAEEGKQTLNALMDYIPEGITIVEGNEATIRMVSRYGQDILGGLQDQITIEQFTNEWKVYDQDGITPLPPENFPLVRAIQQGEVVKNQDLVQVNSAGQRFSLTCSAGPIRNAAGKITGGVIAWREVSEHKQLANQLSESHQALLLMQEQLRQQNDLLERLVQHAPAGIAFQTGPDYIYTLANQEYMRFAQGKGDLIGRKVSEVWPEIADIVLPQYDHVFKTGEAVSVLNAPLAIVRNGVAALEYYTYTHTPIYKADGSIEGVMTLAIDTTQSVRDHQAVEAQSARLEAVLQALPIGVWIADANGRIIGKNELADQIWAGDAPLSEGVDQYQAYQAWDAQTGQPVTTEAYPLTIVFRTGQPVKPVEHRILRFDGSEGYVLVSATPIKDSAGQLAGAVAINLDITHRKQVESALRRKEADLREAQRLAHIGNWSWDASTDQTVGSEELYHIYGLDPDEQLLPSFNDQKGVFYPEESWERLNAEVQRALRTGKGYEIDVEALRNGKPIWVTTRSEAILDGAGQIIGLRGTVQDITERKRAEQLLRENERHLREANALLEGLIEGTQDLIAVQDLNFNFLARNTAFHQAMAQIFGSDVQVGTNMLTMLSHLPEDLLNAKTLWGRAMQGEIVVATGEFGDPNMKRGVFEMHFFPIYGADGKVIAAGEIANDVTERVRMEEALKTSLEKLAHSNEELEQFAFVASHDLQEPLRKILLFGNILRNTTDGKLSDESEDALARMQNAAERMKAMIEGLLDLSRVNTRGGSFEPIQLTSIVQEVISDLEPRIRAVGGQVILEPLPTVIGDSLQIHRLLQNLIGNGLKFHREGIAPVVHVSGQIIQDGPASRAVIVVRDNGIGFDAVDAERIFQPFVRLFGRSAYEGSGIGLAISRKIAERHGGSLVANSQPGQGSQFTVTLPVLD